MRKIFALCLILLFSFSVLLGCGGEKKAAADAKSGTKASTSVGSDKKIAAEKQNAGQIDNVKANSNKIRISEDKAYTDKEHVAAYINEFARLPHNFITKNEAKKLGWQSKGTLDRVAPGKSIGGDRYGNYEGRLPKKNGRTWKECDIDYVKGSRNAKRIVFSSDGLIYYTSDHYKTFTQLY